MAGLSWGPFFILVLSLFPIGTAYIIKGVSLAPSAGGTTLHLNQFPPATSPVHLPLSLGWITIPPQVTLLAGLSDKEIMSLCCTV